MFRPGSWSSVIPRRRSDDEVEREKHPVRNIVMFLLILILVVFLVLLLLFLNGRTNWPQQLKFTVDSYYYGVEDGINQNALAGYICPERQGNWRAAQDTPDGDTRRGIVDHDITSATSLGGHWSVHVTLKLSGDTKEHVELTLHEDKTKGTFLICGGTDHQ